MGTIDRWFRVGVACAAGAVLGACGETGETGESAGPQDDAASADTGTPGRYSVVATVGMIGDVAHNLAGDRATVETLVPADVDPHLYSPTRNDIQKLIGADLLLYNGRQLEGKMGIALEKAAQSGTLVVAVAEVIDEGLLLRSGEIDETYDPHVWMNPVAWGEVVAVVQDSLAELDPDGEPVYAAASEVYRAELAELDAYAEEVLASVPEQQRVLVTAHDAFNYFGRRYGFEVVGVQGLSTEAEAGVRDVERLVDLIVDRGIRAVFVESTVSDRSVQALIGGAKARGQQVVVGGELYSDAMGPEGTYEGTYLGMIDHNVTTIARSLGGDAPEGGRTGRLAAGRLETGGPSDERPQSGAEGGG
ncbi:MAG: zinc ABC transporter substrate-binding protein [Planctomycetota bacterium]